MASAQEVNFDGLVGPTHTYAGLSHGNVASMSHRGAVSHPREAALQGLEKMRLLADLGVPQAVLPPHERPSVETLRALGFSGRDDATVLRAAARHAPAVLAACSSASAMWVANAATIAPSSDTADGRVHLTTANLVSKFHRSIEPVQTARTLRAIFRDPAHFAVHDPVPGGAALGDEGAANHTRLAPTHGHRGLHVFVYGHDAFATLHRPDAVSSTPRRFASRQSREASEAVARCNQLGHTPVFLRQHPQAIDAGVFHHDVIAVGNENVLFHHEAAFFQPVKARDELRARYAALHRGAELYAIRVPACRVPLADAVRSYLFNSQLITVAPGHMVLVAPIDCRETPPVRSYLDDLVAAARTTIRDVRYVDLRQSMRNGGGPACLRLRVVLTPAERAVLPAGVWFTPERHAQLAAWVRRHYRERLAPADLADPALLAETHRALDELTRLLGLGSIYAFQR